MKYNQCRACEEPQYKPKKFDKRFQNEDFFLSKTKSKGQNERNLTSDQLLELGIRKPEKEYKKRRIGGPNEYKDREREKERRYDYMISANL